MSFLHFAIAPSRPDQPRRLRPGQPSLARFAFRRQHHRDDRRAVSLAVVIIDGGAQFLELAAGGGLAAAGAHISAAELAIDVCECFLSEEIQ
jgi:hypothetical protein